MTAQLPTLRSGLPRRPGGGPWPPASAVPEAVAGRASVAPVAAVSTVPPVPPAQTSAAAESAPAAPSAPAMVQATPEQASAASAPARESATRVDAGTVPLRSGLPRLAGGAPWPPSGMQATAAAPAAADQAPAVQHAPTAQATQTAADTVQSPRAAVEGAGTSVGTMTTPAQAQPATSTIQQDLRQGLPREHGGQPWPAVSQVQLLVRDAAVPGPAASAAPVEAVQAAQALQGGGHQATDTAPRAATPPAAHGQEPAAAPAQTETPAPTATSTAEPESVPRAIAAWLRTTLGKSVAAAVILLLVAGAAVLGARWFLGTDSGQAFLAANPGEYHLPDTAPVGFPAWLGWQHFMNAFLMVLIIRSGLQIRRETRPTAYWTSRRKNATKTSITAWFHQSLDLLWLANGALFMVLLFATGQWMRVVPTSWEVFPNAVSAGLQYLSLDWPTDNGWVNYNALQQLAYFTTIFVAAPLAAASGFRMSGWWPKQAKKLSALYPIEVARKIHVPVMVYFVVFIAIHVILVMATGALRNLNHMYAAQGSVDPAAYAENWFGFWMFVLSLAIIGGALAASRPLVLAPLASVFGKVSSR